MKTVYEFVFSFWSTVSKSWDEVSYWTVTPNNNQFMTETLIRDEEGKVENIMLQVKEHTLDWYDDCGYDRDMLI